MPYRQMTASLLSRKPIALSLLTSHPLALSLQSGKPILLFAADRPATGLFTADWLKRWLDDGYFPKRKVYTKTIILKWLQNSLLMRSSHILILEKGTFQKWTQKPSFWFFTAENVEAYLLSCARHALPRNDSFAATSQVNSPFAAKWQANTPFRCWLASL